MVSQKMKSSMTFEHSSSSLGRQCQMASAENNTSGPASFFIKGLLIITVQNSEYKTTAMNSQVQSWFQKLFLKQTRQLHH
ncbi:hypothetical protein Tco_0141492, partial [Tanacetum coccineum]